MSGPPLSCAMRCAALERLCGAMIAAICCACVCARLCGAGASASHSGHSSCAHENIQMRIFERESRVTRPSSCAAGRTRTWTGTCESVWKLRTWTCAASQLGRISSLREQRPPSLGPVQKLPRWGSRCLDAMMMRQIQVLLVRQAPAMSAVGLWPEHGCDRGSVALPDCHLELLSPRLERKWPRRAELRGGGEAGAP